MIVNIDISKLDGLFCKQPSRPTTKLEVVQEVMGVPAAAVRAIARKAGVEGDLCASACIEENALSYFADAYVRKMKAYFNRAKRSVNQLGTEEQAAFVRFCSEFSKTQPTYQKSLSWANIDEEAIREAFYEQIRRKSQREENATDSLFPCLMGMELALESKPKPSNPLQNTEQIDKRIQTLRAVQCSILYYCPLQINIFTRPRSGALWQIMRAAHYYIRRADDEHLEDTIIL